MILSEYPVQTRTTEYRGIKEIKSWGKQQANGKRNIDIEITCRSYDYRELFFTEQQYKGGTMPYSTVQEKFGLGLFVLSFLFFVFLMNRKQYY